MDDHLQQVRKEDRLSVRRLQAKLQKEWQRTESERANAPTCPGSGVMVIDKEERAYVQEALHTGEVSERRTLVPLAQWWNWVVQPEGLWGQYSPWSAQGAWMRRKRQDG